MRANTSNLNKRRRMKLSLEHLEPRQLLSTITVNTTADSTAAGATLSLRQAIEVSNGALAVSSLSAQQQALVSGTVGSSNTVDFDIPTTDAGYSAATGVWTIALQSALPSINQNAAIIDGYSQPGATKNTLAQGDNAKLEIAIEGVDFEFDGLTLAAQGSQVSGLDVEKFENGIVIAASGNIQVAGCFIGTDPTGESAGSNANGVVIQGSSNLIGGPNVGDRNVISDNIQNSGIYVPDLAVNPLGITPTGNLIENNFIGLDAAGTKGLPNGLEGVADNGSGNTYGGTTAGLGNVISGNGEYGIVSTGNITIEGNYVGTDPTGSVAIGNGKSYSGGTGISVSEPFHVTSITAVVSNNLVSGNDDGISISIFPGGQSSFTIANNLIGTDASGTKALRNAGTGLTLDSVEHATVQNNVISGNYEGVMLQTSAPVTEAENNVFLGNLIGTDKTGSVALGNTGVGIYIDSGSGITVGGTGPGQGNTIANNLIGIDLTAGQQDEFIQNSIYGNSGEYGVPPGIVIGSANQSVTAPVLLFTHGSGGTATLSGTLTEAPNTKYDVELYSNPSATTAAEAEGQTFVHDFTVTTDGTGNGTFTAAEPSGFYTATATDPSGNTSVFSSAVGGAQPAFASSTTAVSSSLNPATVGQPVTFTAVVTAPSFQGTPTGTVTLTIDGQPQAPVQLSVVGGVDEAQFSTSALSPGSHTVTASYSGDSNVSPSSGSLPTQMVTARSLVATKISLTSALNPSTVGQPVTFAVIVSPGATAGTPTGSVTFTIDGTALAPVPLHLIKGIDEATVSIATLTSGSHTISAAYSGDSTFAASAVSEPLRQTVQPLVPGVDGPRVEAVQRFGVHMQPTVLVLSFNQALEAVSATNMSNYRIMDPSGNRVRIKSAIYDSKTNTVTLRPAERINLHHTYRLTVIGTGPNGLRNTQGALLDGTNSGIPDGNYAGTLSWRNVVLTPAELAKVHHESRKPSRPEP